MCWSIDHYNTDPCCQATYHNGHKIAFSLWPIWIKIVKSEILVIKKTSMKILQVILSVLLNMPIKHIQEKKRNLTVKEKEHSFISTCLQLQHWKNKDNDFLCQLCFLSLCLFWLMAYMCRLEITWWLVKI